MRKSKLYRVGALFMAALMVITCVPQAGLYAAAEEADAVADQYTEAEVQSEDLDTQSDTAVYVQEETDDSSEQLSQENEGGITPNAEGDAGTEEPVVISVESITLNQKEISIQRKKTAELTYKLAPANANDGLDVTFASSDETIVKVAQNGTGAMISAVGKGEATITATTGNGKQASCKVVVTPIPVDSITIKPSELELDLNETVEEDESNEAKQPTKTLTVSVEPEDADDLDVYLLGNYNKGIISAEFDDYKEDAPTKQIKVTGLKGGTTTLVAVSSSNNRIYSSCDITVKSKKVELEELSAKTGYPQNLYEGTSIELSKYVVYNPANVEDKTLTWTIGESDGEYVEVNPSSGRTTAKWEDETDTSDEHDVTVTATSENKKTVTFNLKIKRKNVPLQELYVFPEELVLEDAGRENYKTVRLQLNPLTSTDRKITATVSEKSDTTTAVVVNAGKNYDEGNAGKTATASADTNGMVYFTVKANALEGLTKQDTCKITFTVANSTSKVKTECSVTINKYVTPVEKLELSTTSLTMKDGTEADLTATIGPLTAEDRHIVWTVDDPEIAEIKNGVDADGRNEAALVNGELSASVKVKANMVGTCKITVTAAGNVKKTCEVEVKNGDIPADGLVIKSDSIKDDETTEIYLKPGQTYVLKPEVTPANASNKKVKWTSGSPAVASVKKGTNDDGTANENGVVTANALGICTITARASGESSACTKTVTVHVVSPKIEVHYQGEPNKWTYVPEDQPISEEDLRKELEVFFWPRVNPVPKNDRWTLGRDESNHADYTLRILREDGKSEKVYEPEDMQKPGIKTFVIFYEYDGVTYKASIQAEMKEFDEADLISVTPLSGEDTDIWNVPNGTPASSLPLPEKTEITVGRTVIVKTDDGPKEELKLSKLDAKIIWDVAACGYDPANNNEQEFLIAGTVQLPDYVKNPDNVSLVVEARVHVREQNSTGKRAERPVFSVLDGQSIANKTAIELPYGSKIILTTPTEGADIYYMVDRRPDEERGIPHDVEHQYKSPIVITSKTTTIYAVAACYGYEDSECSECTIKLIQADLYDPDDPDAPLPDDVTDEDKEQIGGKVPDGLWAVVQKGADEKDGFAYTGKAIKPAVRVYDRTMLLTEKTDYTIAYSNNVNAGSAVGSATPPTIMVTGKGNYEGKAVVHFTIKPQDIKDDSVFMDEYVAVAYNGKAQKPNPSLTWNEKKLSKNKDYTYTDVSYTEPGIYKVTVEGKGNYTGTRTMDYEIYQGGVSVSKLTISKVANQKYTGREIRPEVTVKYKNTVLNPGTEKGAGNYWIKYENCTKVGTASIVIVGKGNYKGSKRINFKILPTAKISQAGITLDIPAAGVAYTGKPYTPKCTVNYLGTELKENKDYKLNYQNNTKAGTATVVITGMGAYTGTAKKTFKIMQNDISGLAAAMETSFAYEKGGCKPKPTVICNGMELKEGTDYTLTYKNNNKIGNTASVTVKGKGNYKGQIVRYFEVTMQDISKLKVVASDKVYQQKNNIYKTKVQVIDLNGKALTAGTDYAKDVYYTYESGSKAGQPVLSKDIIPVGTVIGVDVRVSNPRCYQGTVHGTYRFVQADVSGAKVSINPQEYTGRSIRPKKSQIQVILKGVQLRNDDYEIVGYENNVKQGNAKITIRGTGSYGGTKTATFKIKKKGILNLKF